jgi:ribosomal protein S24E
MGLKILTEKENPFFNRKEIEANIEADITPKKSEAEELISKKFSISPENVKVKGIKGKFGSKDFIITANVYSSKEHKNKTEAKSKKEREAEKKALKENKEEEKK